MPILHPTFRFHGSLVAQFGNEAGLIAMPPGFAEIIETSGDGGGRTFLRWAPHGSGGLLELPPTPLNLHSETEAVRNVLTTAAAEANPSEVFFAVGKPPKSQVRTLRFSNVLAMDRMALDQTETLNPVQDLRLPCLPECQRGATRHLSQVIIGMPGFEENEVPAAYVSYKAIVPLPAPFGTMQAGEADQCFVMGARHGTDANSGTLQVPKKLLVWGWSKEHVFPVANITRPFRFGDAAFGAQPRPDTFPPVLKLDVPAAAHPSAIRLAALLSGLGVTPGAEETKKDPTNATQILAFSRGDSADELVVECRKQIRADAVRLGPDGGPRLAPVNRLVGVRLTSRFAISDTDLAEPGASGPMPGTIEMKLAWIAQPGPRGYPVFLDDLDAQFGAARTGLLATQSQPQNALPEFVDFSDRAPIPPIPMVAHVGVKAVEQVGSVLILPTATPTPVAATLDGAEIPVRMRLPGLDNRKRKKLPHDHFHVKLVPIEIAPRPDTCELAFRIENDPHFAKLPHGTKYHDEPISGRLGSLDFAGPDNVAPTGQADRVQSVLAVDDGGTLRIRPRGPMQPDGGNPPCDVNVDLPLAINRVRPVTSDIPHGERDRDGEDWLIDVASGRTKDKREEQNYTLKLRQTLRADQDWHMTAALHETSIEQVGLADDILITRSPFAMMRLRRKSLAVPGSDDSNAVATWDSDARAWQFRQDDRPMPISLPAGATGESTDKPGRLEILDDDEPRQEWQTRDVLGRFSGPSTVWVTPREMGRDFGIPAHNARDLLDRRSDTGPGVALGGFVTEMVYGLASGWRMPGAGGIVGPSVRLAEARALTGRLVPDSRDGAHNSTTGDRWSGLRRTLMDRPQHLEAVSLSADGSGDYAPASFSTGLTFVGRRTAVIKAPLAGLTVPEGDFGPRIADHGLPGGVVWPIEQRAFLEELLRSFVSSEGTIDNLAFGPFGSSGTQTARFVNGALAIIVETLLGRIVSLRIEVTGRIATFWHRAKHVVVYRRTTAPSAQFAPEALAATRSNRPIPRKVEEFIDIEQAVRSYPDHPASDPRSAGFLAELRFGTTRIAVDSAWASDVGPKGWRIPLWQRRASEMRPAVYPMPAIVFATRGDGEVPEALTLQDCLDPQKVFFFTDVDQAKAMRDTDAWPAMNRIDGIPGEDAKAWSEELDGMTEASGRRPAAGRFTPGLGTFTWRLAAGSGLTQLNAGRSDKPVFAGLDSITFMRGGFRAPEPEEQGPTKKDALKLPKTLAEHSDAVRAGLTKAPVTPLPSPLAEIQTAKEALDAAFGPGGDLTQVPLLLTNLITAVRAAVTQIADPAQVPDATLIAIDNALFGGKGQQTLHELVGLQADIKRVLDLDKTDCTALANQARAYVAGKKLLVLHRLADLRGDLLDAIKNAPDQHALTDPRDGVIAKAQGAANTAIDRTIDRIDADVGGIEADLADARAIVRDWAAQVGGAYNRAAARLDTFRNSYEDGKPWSATRLTQAEKALNAEFANLADEARAALTEARQRLAADISGHAAGVTTAIDAALRQAVATIDLTPALDTVEGYKRRMLAARDAVDPQGQVQSALATVRTDLDTAITGMPEGAQKDAATDLRARLDAAAAGLERVPLSDWIKKVNGGAGAVVDFVTALDAGIKDGLGQAAADANELVAVVAADATGVVASLDKTVQDALSDLSATFAQGAVAAAEILSERTFAGFFDQLIEEQSLWIKDRIAQLDGFAQAGLAAADGWLGEVQEAIKDTNEKLGEGLRTGLKNEVVARVFESVRDAADAQGPDLAQAKAVATAMVQDIDARFAEAYEAADVIVADFTDLLTDYCETLLAQKRRLKQAFQEFRPWLVDRLNEFLATLEAIGQLAGDALNDACRALKSVAEHLRSSLQEVAEAADAAVSYAMRAVERAGDAAIAVGDQVLRLVSAAGDIPDIGTLGINTDRLRALFDPLSNLIDTTAARAMLDRFGDALSSMKLNLPFSGIGDGFESDFGLPKLTFPDIFPSFGGVGFAKLLPDLGDPSFLKKYVKLTHDLDRKARRAWVKAEVDAPMPGRHKLFNFGPVAMFLVAPRLTGWVRIDADAKTQEVVTTDHGQITTDIEVSVAGQPMVTLRDVVIIYSKDGGLDFKVAPEKIKLHPNFKFLQDFMSRLGVGDGDNGITVLKKDGTPVGLEHSFAIPPISLMYGTSGISNLAISNQFSIEAYPDFVIRDRFALSSKELPFLFSIFIIGGTGHAMVEVAYVPATRAIKTMVTAAAGGSAALGFAFGPVTGSVFISLSVALSYTRYDNWPAPVPADSGLAVSLDLVIAGHVSLWGIVTIYLGLSLSLSYRDSGQIDATGRLSVSVRISKFFKLKYSTTVQYKLRGGRSETVVTSQTSFDKVKDRSRNLANARAVLS